MLNIEDLSNKATIITNTCLNSTWPLSQSVTHACMTMTILDAVPFLLHFAYLFQVCTAQKKTNYHPHCRRFLPYSKTGCDAVWWKSAQYIAKQSSAILSHSEFLELWWQSIETLQVFRRSTYSAMLNHINCLLGDSPLTLMEISAIHEAGGDQIAMARSLSLSLAKFS